MEAKITTFDIGNALRNSSLQHLKDQEEQRENVMSRETMFRFYSKDTEKLKRLQTPGYVGLDSYLSFYKKYKNVDKQMELGDSSGYSPSTAYLSSIQSLKVIPQTLGLLLH